MSICISISISKLLLVLVLVLLLVLVLVLVFIGMHYPPPSVNIPPPLLPWANLISVLNLLLPMRGGFGCSGSDRPLWSTHQDPLLQTTFDTNLNQNPNMVSPTSLPPSADGLTDFAPSFDSLERRRRNMLCRSAPSSSSVKVIPAAERIAHGPTREGEGGGERTGDYRAGQKSGPCVNPAS